MEDLQNLAKDNLELLAQAKHKSDMMNEVVANLLVIVRENPSLVDNIATQLADMVRQGSTNEELNATLALAILMNEFPICESKLKELIQEGYSYIRINF